MELLRWKTRIAVLWIIHMVSFSAYLILSSVEPKVMPAPQTGSLQISEGTKFGWVFLFCVPWIMAWLSLTLKDAANRWTNFVFGILFAAILILTLIGSFTGGASAALQFNIFWGFVVSLLIIWYAWKWPKQEA